ncbi:hypothetical protein ABH963_005958 [Bacillus sp. RC55]
MMTFQVETLESVVAPGKWYSDFWNGFVDGFFG